MTIIVYVCLYHWGNPHTNHLYKQIAIPIMYVLHVLITPLPYRSTGAVQ